jgi:hypothetical protein
VLLPCFDTRPSLTLEFEEQHVYMAGRWEIEREGVKGPPGDIEEVVIP